ncbi:thiopeptide-type bacteriocin biosynthesis protein [Olivibacter jilunii]|uniref:thiopeptide-type bacteriocin biosynthesis protein n=1 Tax=Olivibacter jilunii TaxID=985016 RepID=UPI003F14F47B
MVQLNCLSFHLFYRKEADDMLLECKTFTDQLGKEGLLKDFFFIRYGEGGPHIRLRLFYEGTGEMVLIECLQQWVSECPEILRAEKSAFLPEVERYGGESCLDPALNLFAASSRAVLQWVERFHPVNAGRRIAQAVKLHFVFLQAMDCSLAEMQRVLESFIADWLPMACLALGMEASEGARLLPLFRAQSQMKQELLLQLFADLNEQLLKRCFRDPLLQDYFDETRSRMVYFSGLEQHKRVTVLSSFLHMTNNRLGLSNYDEPFVAFLLLKMIANA